MAELVTKRYAGALYEVAIPLQKQEVFREELLDIMGILTSYPQFDQLIKSPLIQSQDKKEIITKVFQGKVSQEIMNFLYILVDKRRQNHIQEIIHEYIGMVEKDKNIIQAVAYTAEAMSQKDLSLLAEKLSITSGSSVILKNEIDRSIVGGVLVKIGDQVIDGTIKNRLARIKEQLTQIIV